MENGNFSSHEELRQWSDDYSDRMLRLELEHLYRLYELSQEAENE